MAQFNIIYIVKDLGYRQKGGAIKYKRTLLLFIAFTNFKTLANVANTLLLPLIQQRDLLHIATPQPNTQHFSEGHSTPAKQLPRNEYTFVAHRSISAKHPGSTFHEELSGDYDNEFWLHIASTAKMAQLQRIVTTVPQQYDS